MKISSQWYQKEKSEKFKELIEALKSKESCLFCWYVSVWLDKDSKSFSELDCDDGSDGRGGCGGMSSTGFEFWKLMNEYSIDPSE